MTLRDKRFGSVGACPRRSSGLIPDVLIGIPHRPFLPPTLPRFYNPNVGYKSFGKRCSLRLKHYDYSSSRPIHVIIGTYRRRPYLTNRLLVGKLVSQLRTLAEECGVAIYAYCFMSDHHPAWRHGRVPQKTGTERGGKDASEQSREEFFTELKDLGG